jgi:hypothetical protein
MPRPQVLDFRRFLSYTGAEAEIAADPYHPR